MARVRLQVRFPPRAGIRALMYRNAIRIRQPSCNQQLPVHGPCIALAARKGGIRKIAQKNFPSMMVRGPALRY